jgi:hypothetical protein
LNIVKEDDSGGKIAEKVDEVPTEMSLVAGNGVRRLFEPERKGAQMRALLS